MAFGGSSSGGIGVIWISGYGELDQNSIAELLLHELTHHQLFIDECCHAHYDLAEIIKPENFSISAILNKRRPLDKVVHSIIVATEILLARSRFLRQQETKLHGHSEVLMNKTVTAIGETMGMPNINKLLTERTREMLARALSCLKGLDSPLLADAAIA